MPAIDNTLPIEDVTPKPNDKTSKLMALAERAFNRRSVWETVWDQVFELVIPERFKRRNEVKTPETLYSRIYDSTAVESAQQLANTMVSGLVPPWVQWFKIEAGPGIPLEDRRELNEALQFVNETLFLHLNLSNLTQEIQPAFLDSTVGTGCIRLQPKKGGTGVEFKCVPITQLAIEENSRGVVDSVFRIYHLKAREIVEIEKWMSKIQVKDPTLAKRLRDTPDESVEVLETNTPLENGKNHNAIILKSSAIMLSEKDMPRNPYIVFRWAGVPGHAYGRGPATITFGDIRSLNKVKELVLKNLSRVVGGIWSVKGDSTINTRNTVLRGGTLMTVRSNDSTNPDIRELPQNGNFDAAQFGIGDLRASVKAAFLADQFSPTQGTKMTATEIIARSRIVAQNLGATYGRLQNELLIPLVRDVIAILIDQDELPDDIKLDRKNFDVTFLSSLALSQRLQEVDNMVQFSQISASIAELDPQAGLIIDPVKFQERIAELLDVKPELLRDDEAIEETVQQGIQGLQAVNQEGTVPGGGQQQLAG